MMRIEFSKCGNYLKQGMLLWRLKGRYFEHCMTMDNADIEQMIEVYEQQSKLVDKALSGENS